MGFKEVSSLDADVTISIGGFNKKTNKKNPTTAEGYYLGSREVKSPKSKTGLAWIHFLQTPDGNLGVWGKTDMDRKISTVTPGTMVRITFDKMVSVPGKNDMYKFKIEVDESERIEVDLAPTTTTGTESEETTEDEATETEDTEEDAAVAAAAAQAARDRQAKVQKLLDKNTKTK